MVTLAGAIIAYLRAFFAPRHKVVLEAVALRQQLAVVKRKQAAPQTRSPRSVVLDCALSVVGPLVRSLNHRPAGDRGFLAPCRIPAVLAVGSQRRRSGRPPVMEQIRRLIRRMKAEGGKSHLGRAPHPRRTAPARLRDLRAHRFPLSGETRWSLG